MAQDLTLRGKLVIVGRDDSVDLYTEALISSRLAYAIQGGLTDTTIGTATGEKFTLPAAGTTPAINLIEVLAPRMIPGYSIPTLGGLSFSLFWVNARQVQTVANPNYKPADDTGRDDYVPPTGNTKPDDTEIVVNTPGKDTMPVEDGTGKTVYVSEKQLKDALDALLKAAGGTKPSEPPKNNYLLWGIGAALVLALVVLTVVLIRLYGKPKN